MTREELLKHCRYYKGEEKCPYTEQNKAAFWEYEKDWVQSFVLKRDIGIRSMAEEYFAYGLFEFNEDDGVPVSLKAILFNRFSHWNRASADEFKLWYKTYYLQQEH